MYLWNPYYSFCMYSVIIHVIQYLLLSMYKYNKTGRTIILPLLFMYLFYWFFFLFSQQSFVDKISQVLHFFLTIGILMAPRPYPYMGCPIRPLIGRFIPRNIIGPPPIPMDPPPLTGCIPPRIGFIPPLTSKSPPSLLPYKTQGL